MTVSTDLDRRFRDAAVRAGLLDAGFDIVDSPVGPLLVAATTQGLLRISFDADPGEQLDRLARIAGRRILRAPRAVWVNASSAPCAMPTMGATSAVGPNVG